MKYGARNQILGKVTAVKKSAVMCQVDLSADGPVDLTFSDGSHLTAAHMNFDGKADLWSFDQATLVVPNLPKQHPYWGNVFLVFAPSVVTK